MKERTILSVLIDALIAGRIAGTVSAEDQAKALEWLNQIAELANSYKEDKRKQE